MDSDNRHLSQNFGHANDASPKNWESSFNYTWVSGKSVVSIAAGSLEGLREDMEYPTMSISSNISVGNKISQSLVNLGLY